jgi:heme/copper-type cytochrome/quinol oxidase subunit 3
MMTDDQGVIGMAVFLASEAVFFVFLIIAYVYFSGSAAGASASRAALDPVVTGAYTVALVASSATVWRADVLARQRRAGTRWVLATAVLGVVFLVGQGREYARLVQENVTVGHSLFGTTFFTLTGFHGFHVLIGVLLLAIVWAVGLVDRGVPAALTAVSLYWHFVDIVWIVIFALVYVRPFV